jgi:hypothetical protein
MAPQDFGGSPGKNILLKGFPPIADIDSHIMQYGTPVRAVQACSHHKSS